MPCPQLNITAGGEVQIALDNLDKPLSGGILAGLGVWGSVGGAKILWIEWVGR